MIRYCIFLLLIGLSLLAQSCSKTDFLNEKPNQSLVIPNSLDDLQAILDFDRDMNGVPRGQGLVPQLLDIASDDYYVLAQAYRDRLDPLIKMYYSWDPKANTDESNPDWERPYLCVFNANIVLDHLEELKPRTTDTKRWSEIRGAALFYRAHAFYQLAQVYAYPYGITDYDEYGIPLRKTGDVLETIERAPVTEVYQSIVKDLSESSNQLPLNSNYKERPTKISAWALLARVYLNMGDYTKALIYADSVIMEKNELLDYNLLTATAAYPFNNTDIIQTEVLFKSSPVTYPGKTSPIAIAVARINPDLYSSYEVDDLRKNIFFTTGSTEGYRFKGSYYGTTDLFSGIALDEIYLIKAECLVRATELDKCVEVLEYFRRHRYRKNTETYRVPSILKMNQEGLLNFVLLERRKQLVFRGLRWSDLRRLNREGENITINRIIEGEEHLLSPNNKRYAYLIPQKVMGFNPEMNQNPR